MCLVQDFEALGLSPGDAVMLHSSFKSLGPIEGGIQTLISNLMKVLTQRGTLMIPTPSYDYVPCENPVFDVRRTHSCIGAVPEFFRQMPGVVRSLSPTHSVAALGRYAREITQDHLLDETPIGPHSPYRYLAQAGGKLLFLGCGLRPNTSIHGVEELVEVPYLFLPGLFPFTVVDEEGRSRDINYRRHSFKQGHIVYEQRYERVLDLLDSNDKTFGKVGEADSWLLDSRAVWEMAESALRKDAFAMVDLILSASG